MKITTKYNIGDKVVKIWRYRKKDKEICTACLGKMIYKLADGKSRNCPECRGDGYITFWHDDKWNVEQEITIGEIRVELNKNKREETYMCYETGIGSGTLHPVETLLPTKEEAQKECDKLNKIEAKK